MDQHFCRSIGRRALLGIFLAAFSVAATAAHAAEPATKGTLSGTVVDPDGKPVAGARVSVSTFEFDNKTLTS
ncbi:MAG: carboxypeptidase regulatory-like domain-containing protein [Planctomycetia bacterium]|nr:carboxypeptidase regulatory-like domain-containing protein [Planctomycetia bacterium]